MAYVDIPRSFVLIRDICGSTLHHHNRDEACSELQSAAVSAGTQQRIIETSYPAFGFLSLNYGALKETTSLTKTSKS